jgi:hypothetical protein|tara:strand:+ start:694 stop:963 length:270 start_codon:yes stop_codon:yes gene_type:complete
MKTLNNMELQYIDQESVENFINGMVEVETETILEDPQFSQILKGAVPQQILKHDNPLGTIESFLQLFIDREEYEVCAKLVDKVPELRHF